MLLEQFGGANGELAAAMQYTVQGWSCDDTERRDLLLDIGTEEISHLEIVGALIRMHLQPMKKALEDAEQDPLVAVAGGGGLNLYNSMGSPWTADYLKVSGELDVDLRNNIAAEARAEKITYERLLHLTDDQGSERRPAVPHDPRNHPHRRRSPRLSKASGRTRSPSANFLQRPDWSMSTTDDSTGDGANGAPQWLKKNGLQLRRDFELLV